MLSKLKRWRAAYFNHLRQLHDWYVEHAMERKLFISGTLVLMMVALLIGTRLTPSKSKFADSRLNQAEAFGENNSATITMLSRQYNAKEKFMVIKFRVANQSNQIIDPKNINLKAQLLDGKTATYQVLPLANNNFVMVVSNLNKGYRAIRVVAKNEQPDLADLTTTDDSIDDSASSSSSSQMSSESSISKNTTKFTINEDNKFVDNNLRKKTQREYAVDSLNSSIKYVNKQIKAQRKNIVAYKKQAQADKAAVNNTQDNQQYKVDKSSDQQSIENAKSDYQTQQTNIKNANKRIAKYKEQIKLYQKQINDVNSGRYRFQAPIKTGKIK